MAIAPRWALRRQQMRTATTVTRHYEAAVSTRRTTGWARNATDADITIRGAMIELRMHARDLIRNNAWARRAQRVIANNTVGTGIVPKATDTDAGTAAKSALLWKRWAGTTECESEGRHTFAGIQHLVMKSVASDGEVLIRRRFRLAKDDLTIPLQLQILEADYLDHSKQLLSSDAGGPIISGVEFDLLGRRAAYWIYPKHPGSGLNYQASVRTPATEILHIYYSERPGQSRGVSWFSAAILPLKDFDDYEDATLMRQKIAACFAAFVADIDGSGTALGEQNTADAFNEVLEPGMIKQLKPGETVTFGTPPTVTGDGFDSRTLHRIAAALGITYEDMTGDLERVNFSSARMGRIAHYENVKDWRWNMLIPLLCDGVWSWAMEAACLAGELKEAPAAEWTCPPMPMIEPDKEGLAISRLVRNGVTTFSEMIREQGGDPEAHFAEYAADLKRLKALGIVLDSDASETTAAGMAQIEPPDPSETPPKSLPAGKRDDTTEYVEIEIGDLS